MGVAIINSTLGLLFKDRSRAAAKLKETLEGLAVFNNDNATSPEDRAFWKCADGSSIALNDFLDYVVQPYVANYLIMEDLEVSEMKADEIRTASRKYGLKFNFETDDGRVDNITMDGMASAPAKV